MYAIVKVKGKQYKVSQGESIRVDRVEQEVGQSFQCEDVLLVANEGDVNVGTPLVEGANVQFTVKENIRGEKIRVVKFKRRKGYERSLGHRSHYSILSVDSIKA